MILVLDKEVNEPSYRKWLLLGLWLALVQRTRTKYIFIPLDIFRI